MKLIDEHKTKDIIQNLSDIDRIDTFKLLDIYVSSDLSWNNHVTFIYKCANSRLHLFATEAIHLNFTKFSLYVTCGHGLGLL